MTISEPELRSNNIPRDSALAAENWERLEKRGVARPMEKQSQYPYRADDRDQMMVEEGAASKLPHIGCARLLEPDSPLEAF